MSHKFSTEDLVSRLNKKLKAEEEACIKASLPEYIRLNRTRFNSSHRKEMTCYRRMAAIRLAIEVLTKPIREIDVLQAVISTVPVTNTELRQELEEKAASIYLNERKEACQKIFENSLPIFKKEMKRYILEN